MQRAEGQTVAQSVHGASQHKARRNRTPKERPDGCENINWGWGGVGSASSSCDLRNDAVFEWLSYGLSQSKCKRLHAELPNLRLAPSSSSLSSRSAPFSTAVFWWVSAWKTPRSRKPCQATPRRPSTLCCAVLRGRPGLAGRRARASQLRNPRFNISWGRGPQSTPERRRHKVHLSVAQN